MSIPSPFEFIPSQFHLAFLFLVGILGFLIVIGFSSVAEIQVQKSVTIVQVDPAADTASIASELPVELPSQKSPSSPEPETTPNDASFASPVKSPSLASKYGSVATPGGRRSARLASKSAQKKPRE